ncbi:MAG TPA: tetratricopeptide repeat protein [Pyrinomonadaceae bacterium]
MSQIERDQLKLIDVRSPLLRLLLLVPVTLVLLGSWYAGRWYVGDVVAEYAPGLESGAIETARWTTGLAPADPLTHWTVAMLEKQVLPPEQWADALRHFEQAVSLSPNDYRLWLDLGRAREQSGDRAGAEKALRRAVELAPVYAEPRWQLGNVLLRAGRAEEAFAELQLAADQDPRLRPQIFNMAWYVFGQDVNAISRAAGNSPATRADLVAYLMGRQLIDDALGQWNGLSAADKVERRTVGLALMRALLDAKRFHAAFKIYSDIDAKDAGGIKTEQIANGGFESDIGLSEENPFDWRVRSLPQAQVGLDERYRRSGNRSLRVLFQAPAQLNFDTIGQAVLVEPQTSYRLEFYARTTDLKSASTPVIQVQDGADRSVLASSAPLPVGTNEWQSVALNFKTGSKTEAIFIATNRSPCDTGEGAACPIFGIVWYDDFNLQRGAADATAPRGGSKDAGRASRQGTR